MNMIYDEYAHMYSYIPGYEFSMDHDQLNKQRSFGRCLVS